MAGSAWTNQPEIASLIIIEAGSGAFVGLFVYNGAPAHGTLIASIAAAPGTDPFGNAYLAGITSYNGAPQAFAQLVSNILQLGSAVTDLNPATLQGGDGLLQVSSGTTTPGTSDTALEVLVLSAQRSSGTSPQLVVGPIPVVPATDSVLEVQGPASVSGLLAAGAGATVAGLLAVAGNATVAGQLTVGPSADGQLLVAFAAGEVFLELPLNTATIYSIVPVVGAAELAGGAGQFAQLLLQSAKRQARPDLAGLALNSSDGTNPSNLQAIYTDTGGTGHAYLNIDNTGAELVGEAIGTIPGITPARADSWNNLGTPAGWTVTAARYVASGVINGIWIDIMVAAPAGGATTATFPNTLPAAYRPTAQRIYPAGNTSATAANARISVSAAGSVQIVGLPAGFAGNVGASFLLATN